VTFLFDVIFRLQLIGVTLLGTPVS